MTSISIVYADFDIRGEVAFFDECETNQELNECPLSITQLHFVMVVDFSTLDGVSKCSEPAPVDSEDLTYKGSIFPTCMGHDIILKARFETDMGYVQKPPSLPIIKWNSNRPMQPTIMRILRTRNPNLSSRRKMFNKGVELMTSDIDAAMFFLTEASRGNDIDYTAAAANLLYKKELYKETYSLLDEKDLDIVSPDSLTHYRLTMLKGYSAREAGMHEESIESFRDAQDIYPKSSQPISVAITVIRRDIYKTDDPKKISALLSNDEKIAEDYLHMYNNWDIQGRPSTTLAPSLVIDPSAISFTIYNTVEM